MKNLFIILTLFIAFFMQYGNVLADNTAFNKYYGKYKNEAENKYYSDIQETMKTCGNYKILKNTRKSCKIV